MCECFVPAQGWTTSREMVRVHDICVFLADELAVAMGSASVVHCRKLPMGCVQAAHSLFTERISKGYPG